MPVDGNGEPEPYLATPALEDYPVFLPDGKWVAYQSSESGSPAIYVQSYPLGGGKWQVSENMGVRPTWSRDGREIFYRTDEGLSVVAVDSSGGTLRPEKARPLFTGSFLGDVGGLAIGGLDLHRLRRDARRPTVRHVFRSGGQRGRVGEPRRRLVRGARASSAPAASDPAGLLDAARRRLK